MQRLDQDTKAAGRDLADEFVGSGSEDVGPCWPTDVSMFSQSDSIKRGVAGKPLWGAGPECPGTSPRSWGQRSCSGQRVRALGGTLPAIRKSGGIGVTATVGVDVTNPPAHGQNKLQRTAGRDHTTLELTMTDPAKLTFTVPETASLLGISRAHAYELVARNELPAIRLGRRVVVPCQALQDFLQRSE